MELKITGSSHGWLIATLFVLLGLCSNLEPVGSPIKHGWNLQIGNSHFG